jgi:hypothetical protein
LGLLHFSTQGSDFTVLLLNHNVESLNFLSQPFDFILGISTHPLESDLVFLESFLKIIIFDANNLELILKLV